MGEKENFEFFIKRCSNSLERLLFYSEREQTLFDHLFVINTKDEKRQLFYQTQGLWKNDQTHLLDHIMYRLGVLF